MNKSIKIALTMEFLTPLHIGSGKTLRFGQDVFRSKDGDLFVISFDKLLEELSTDRHLFAQITDALSRGEGVERLIPEERLKKYEIYKLENVSTAYAIDVSGFIKDAHNRPFVPASSIKGGLRTLILRAFLMDHPEFVKRFENYLRGGRVDKKQINNFEEDIFGRNAQKDLLKALRVVDAYFDGLVLATVKVLDLSNDGSQCGWRKAAGQEGRLESIDRATPINVEVGFASSVQAELYIDTFFVERFTTNLFKVTKPKWFTALFNDFYRKLADYSKKFALYDIDYEIDFLNEYASRCNITDVIKKYKALKEQVKSEDGIFMHIAWGIDWRGMGGSILSDESALTLAHSLGLDRHKNADIFPKTRRYITINLDKKGERAKFPLGWVRLSKGGAK